MAPNVFGPVVDFEVWYWTWDAPQFFKTVDIGLEMMLEVQEGSPVRKRAQKC
jgi:hypothetical protein